MSLAVVLHQLSSNLRVLHVCMSRFVAATAYFGQQAMDLSARSLLSLPPLLSPTLISLYPISSGDHPLLSPLLACPRTTWPMTCNTVANGRSTSAGPSSCADPRRARAKAMAHQLAHAQDHRYRRMPLTKTLGTRTGETGGPPRTATENARRALTTSHNRLMGSQFFVPSRSCRGRVVQIHNAGELDSIDLETTVLLINDYDRNFTQLLNVSRES